MIFLLSEQCLVRSPRERVYMPGSGTAGYDSRTEFEDFVLVESLWSFLYLQLEISLVYSHHFLPKRIDLYWRVCPGLKLITSLTGLYACLAAMTQTINIQAYIHGSDSACASYGGSTKCSFRFPTEPHVVQ